jgi:hypothetical protein
LVVQPPRFFNNSPRKWLQRENFLNANLRLRLGRLAGRNKGKDNQTGNGKPQKPSAPTYQSFHND